MNDKCEHSAYWQDNYDTCMACRAEIAETRLKASREETAALAAKFAGLETAEVMYLDVTRRLEEDNTALKADIDGLKNGVYRGNSVGYIYDKMTCYRDQVGFAFDALRLLGWKHGDSNGNREMRIEVLTWAESLAEKIAAHSGQGEKP